MLGELVRAVLERALEAELTAHLGYEQARAGRARRGELPQRRDRQDGADRGRAGAAAGAAGPGGDVRAAAGAQAGRAGRRRPGRHGHQPLRARHVACATSCTTSSRSTAPSCRHETVSRITDAVLEEVRAWQSRPLDPVYAVVFLDAIVVKVRDNQVVQNKPAYIAIGDRRRRGEARAGHLAGQDPAGDGHRRGGRPVLGQRHGRPAQPGRPRHPDRLLRRPGRVRGRHHRRVPAHRGPALRRPPHQERLRPGRPPRRRRGRRRSCGRSTPRRPPRPPSTPSPRSPPRPGGRSTRRPPGSGRTPGTTSPRSWPSAPPSASCSTPPTASRA